MIFQLLEHLHVQLNHQLKNNQSKLKKKMDKIKLDF